MTRLVAPTHKANTTKKTTTRTTTTTMKKKKNHGIVLPSCVKPMSCWDEEVRATTTWGTFSFANWSNNTRNNTWRHPRWTNPRWPNKSYAFGGSNMVDDSWPARNRTTTTLLQTTRRQLQLQPQPPPQRLAKFSGTMSVMPRHKPRHRNVCGNEHLMYCPICNNCDTNKIKPHNRA